MDYIKRGFQIVSFLFSAYGGFLIKISPPDCINGFSFTTTVAMIISFLIFLFCSSILMPKQIVRRKQYFKKLIIIMICTFIIAIVTYFTLFKMYVVKNEQWNISFVKGEMLTNTAQKICSEDKVSKEFCEEYLLKNFFTADDVCSGKLWDDNSVSNRRLGLFMNYLICIILLSGTIFFLLEITFASVKKQID